MSGYEELRRQVLQGSDLRGGALFRGRGMAAWAMAWQQTAPTPRILSPSRGGRGSVRGEGGAELVRLLAGMALSHVLEEWS